MFWMYILRCADDSFYIGRTDDLERRLGEHHAGSFACYTQSKRPLLLVHAQAFDTREEALTAERQVKGWSRRKTNAGRRRLGSHSGAFSRETQAPTGIGATD